MSGDINNMDSARAYILRLYSDSKRRSGINLRFTHQEEFYSPLLEKSIKSCKEWNNKLLMAILNGFARETEKDKKYLQIYLQTGSR
jgi:hypothetical protein